MLKINALQRTVNWKETVAGDIVWIYLFNNILLILTVNHNLRPDRKTLLIISEHATRDLFWSPNKYSTPKNIRFMDQRLWKIDRELPETCHWKRQKDWDYDIWEWYRLNESFIWEQTHLIWKKIIYSEYTIIIFEKASKRNIANRSNIGWPQKFPFFFFITL